MKCVHGETQNANEGFNNMIWAKCPKNIFVSRPVLEMGVNSAILQFNEGSNGVTSVLKHFDINDGASFTKESIKIDLGSIANSVRKSTMETQKRRKRLRGVKKGVLDKEILQEDGESFQKGGH